MPAETTSGSNLTGRFAKHWGRYLQTPSEQQTIAPVLLLTVAAIVLTPFLGEYSWGRTVLAFIVGASALMALVRTGAHGAIRKTATVAIIFTTITASGAHAISNSGRTTWPQILATTLFTLLLIVTPTVVVLRLLLRPRVTLDTLAGALTAYLQIGIFFGSLYRLLDLVGNGSFFAGNPPATTQTFQYFSFITMATVGYGDFTPGTPVGQMLAMCEGIFGQIFLVTVVALTVSNLGKELPHRRGLHDDTGGDTVEDADEDADDAADDSETGSDEDNEADQEPVDGER